MESLCSSCLPVIVLENTNLLPLCSVKFPLFSTATLCLITTPPLPWTYRKQQISWWSMQMRRNRKNSGWTRHADFSGRFAEHFSCFPTINPDADGERKFKVFFAATNHRIITVVENASKGMKTCFRWVLVVGSSVRNALAWILHAGNSLHLVSGREVHLEGRVAQRGTQVVVLARFCKGFSWGCIKKSLSLTWESSRKFDLDRKDLQQ